MRIILTVAFFCILFLSNFSIAQGKFVGMEYEPWFHLQASWNSREATPLLGLYKSTDANVIKKHAEWLVDANVDFIDIDWSNILGPPSEWTPAMWTVVNATEKIFDTYVNMEEGKHPKIVMLINLQSYQETGNLTAIANYIYNNYIVNPSRNSTYLYYLNKPLLPILIPYHPSDVPLPAFSDSRFTIRYVYGFLETKKTDSNTLWSWVDRGPYSPFDGNDPKYQKGPVVAYYDGLPESITVTPSYTGYNCPFYLSYPKYDKGTREECWLTSDAKPRNNGETYKKQWEVALQYNPTFLFINQWNEFVAQHGDEYNAELSNDIEPTDPTGWGYRENGGWGFTYLYLTKKYIAQFKGLSTNLNCGNGVIDSGEVCDIGKNNYCNDCAFKCESGKRFDCKIDCSGYEDSGVCKSDCGAIIQCNGITPGMDNCNLINCGYTSTTTTSTTSSASTTSTSISTSSSTTSTATTTTTMITIVTLPETTTTTITTTQSLSTTTTIIKLPEIDLRTPILITVAIIIGVVIFIVATRL